MSEHNIRVANDNVVGAGKALFLNGKPIDEETPIRLKDALGLLFPVGGPSIGAARAAAQKGLLIIWRFGNKDYTTVAAVRGMLGKCRVSNENVSGSAKPGVGPMAQRSKPFGSSSTSAGKSARDALQAKLQKRKPPLTSTSKTNIHPTAP